jgi:nicotinate phosphoribosyltransferase
MDHFFIQAAERDGVPIADSEAEAYAQFTRAFPGQVTLLVDTYDTERGIRRAVQATGGRLTAIRIDCNVGVETLRRARRVLVEEGAPHVKIFVSDRLDEHRVAELAEVADAFGVGENITCSPDSATGIGAVAKLVVNGYGKLTMKLSRGSGKATLPGRLQAYRFADHDLVALADEPAPSGGRPLLVPVWRGRAPLPLPTLDESRGWVGAQLAAHPPLAALGRVPGEGPAWKMVASDRLVAKIEQLVREAGG